MDFTLYLLMVYLLLKSVSCKVLRDNKCTVYDGKCKYDILLSSDCFKPSQAEYRLQNDNEKQINDIEEKLSDINSENSKRLQELEKTITNLIMDTYKKDNNVIVSKDRHLREKPIKYHNKRHARVKSTYNQADENDLLLILQKKFEELRKQLADCLKSKKYFDREIADVKAKLKEARDRIKELENNLSITNKQFEYTKVENQKLKADLESQIVRNAELESLLKELKQKLKETMKQLAILSEDTERCKTLRDEYENKLKDLQTKLDKANYKLLEAESRNKYLEDKLKKVEGELTKVTMENERLISELKIEKEQHNKTKNHLVEKNKQFQKMNETHHYISEQLNNKTLELVECFRAKTAQYCGFEDELICGFVQDNNSDIIDWIRHKETTPSTYTGPQSDHTCRNNRGHYMYVEASSRSKGQKALLWSPRYQGPGEMCVEFYYHMYGEDIGTLNVHTQTAVILQDESEEFEIVWRAYGNQGDVWIRAYLSVTEEVARAGFNVIFEGLLESGHAGDIAMDDFKVWDGTC